MLTAEQVVVEEQVAAGSYWTELGLSSEGYPSEIMAGADDGRDR